MKVTVEVKVTPNERRRFLGGADVTPMIELVSRMLDDVMMVVIEARLAAFEDEEAEALPMAGREDDERAVSGRAAT